MPKIRRAGLPEAVLRHLVRRAMERGLAVWQLEIIYLWLATDPEVPHGKWFKKFPAFILCGEGDLPKTFLLLGQHPDGQEVF